MATDPKNNPNKPADDKLPAAETGNASNPSPRNEETESSGSHQLLDEKAEKYLREVASIEDVPDPQEQQEADETLQREKKKE